MDSDNLTRRSARKRKINSDTVMCSKNSRKVQCWNPVPSLLEKGKGHVYRCRPHLIPPLMKLLSDKQKGFVRKIGFESFLSMSDFEMNKTLTLWLVDKFNCDTEALEFEGGISIPVRPLVKYVLGIPSGPIQVVRVLDLDNCLYSKYSCNNCAKDANTVAKEMCSITEEEPFCIAFMMAILAMYLAPNTTPLVDRSFLGAVQQVGNLKHMDWCNFVANYLFKGIREFKESNSSFAQVKGCVHILSVIFIDLVKYAALEVPNGFPRLAVVTMEHNKWVASQPFASLMVRRVRESVYASVLVKMQKDNIINGEECASSDKNTAVGADQFDISEKDTTCNSAESMQSHCSSPATRSDEEVAYISVSLEPPEDSDRHGRSTPVHHGRILDVNRESLLNSTKCVGLSSNSSNFHHGHLDDNSQKNLSVVNPVTAKVSPAFDEPEIPYVAKINGQLDQCHYRSSSPAFGPTVVSNANELNASHGFIAKEKSQCLEVESQQNLEIDYPNAKNDALVSKKIYSVSADFGTAKPLPNATSLSVVEPLEKDTLAQSAAHEDAHARQGSKIITASSDNIHHQSVEEEHNTEGMQVAPDAATGRNKGSSSTMEKGDRAAKKARVEQAGNGAVVDTSLLYCPICSCPFRPPVFQCKGGHLACSSCLAELPGIQCQKCEQGGAFEIHNMAMDAIVLSAKIRCSYDGCESYVTFHELHDHKSACPHAPCFCTEPGCGFVGPPRVLFGHLTTLHSWPVQNIEYGKALCLQVPVSEPRCLLLAEEDDCVFLLVVGAHGPTTAAAVSVVCLRASAVLRPVYMLEILAKLPPAAANRKANKVLLDIEVESSTRPGDVTVEELPSYLTVPPTYFVGAGASKVVPLEIRIDKMKS